MVQDFVDTHTKGAHEILRALENRTVENIIMPEYRTKLRPIFNYVVSSSTKNIMESEHGSIEHIYQIQECIERYYSVEYIYLAFDSIRFDKRCSDSKICDYVTIVEKFVHAMKG